MGRVAEVVMDDRQGTMLKFSKWRGVPHTKYWCMDTERIYDEMIVRDRTATVGTLSDHHRLNVRSFEWNLRFDRLCLTLWRPTYILWLQALRLLRNGSRATDISFSASAQIAKII